MHSLALEHDPEFNRDPLALRLAGVTEDDMTVVLASLEIASMLKELSIEPASKLADGLVANGVRSFTAVLKLRDTPAGRKELEELGFSEPHLSALSGAPEKDLPDSHEDINLFSVFPATDPDEIGLVRREEIELIKGYRKPQPPLLFSSK